MSQTTVSTITYDRSDRAWSQHYAQLVSLIRTQGLRRICEVGGGANPLLALDAIRELGLEEYTVLDVSAVELAKAPTGYRKLQADICGEISSTPENFDLVFSKMLAEHVPDAIAFHRNVRRLLRPGGLAFHFFPTLYALPFVVNRWLPENITKHLLSVLSPRDDYQHAKFPAYYRLCRGPTPLQLAALRELGYEVLSYTGYFGHESYWRRIPPIARLSAWLSGWLLRHPNPWLTSFAWVTLRRPMAD